MADVTEARVTRRQMLKASGTAAAAAGYALSVETVLAQAIKTDTQGIVAGDQVVAIGSYNMNVYEAGRPAGRTIPSWSSSRRSGGSTSTSRIAPAASPRRASTLSPRSSSSVRGT